MSTDRAEDHRSRRRTGDQPRSHVALPRGDPEPLPDLEPPWHPDPGRTVLVVAGCPGKRFPVPLFPGFDALGALRHVVASGYDYSWFVLDQATLAAEIALSGSEQNGDLTAKNLRLLAGRMRPGPTPEVRAFQERGVDFVSAASVLELAAQMNQLVGEHLVDGESLRRLIEARDLQVRSGLGKDPQVVATAAARRFIGDRLMRVVAPHELLDPKDPGPAGLDRAGRWSLSGCTC